MNPDEREMLLARLRRLEEALRQILEEAESPASRAGKWVTLLRIAAIAEEALKL